jgi:ribonuclease HII
MRRLHASFPAYGWDQNKGYGTRAHCAAIQAQGLSPHHRRTFVSNVDRWGARAEKDDTVSSRTS